MYLDSCYDSIQKTLQTKCHNEGRAQKVKVSKPSQNRQALYQPLHAVGFRQTCPVCTYLKFYMLTQVMENSSNHKGTLKLFFAS